MSTVVVKFNAVPTIDTGLTIYDSLTGIGMSMIFKAARTQKGETVAVSGNIGKTALLYRHSMDTDYNVLSLYVITLNTVTNEVTITANNPLSQFSEIANTTLGDVTTTINNGALPTAFNITNIAIAEATIGNADDDVEITVTSDNQADTITTPISQAVGSNPFTFETPRSPNAIPILMSLAGKSDLEFIRVPKLLSAYINIDIQGTPSGGTITINRLYPLSNTGSTAPLLLTFEYSLDGVNYVTSNSFSGIAAGNYDVYIKDNIGSEITIPIVVPAFNANLVDYDAIVEVSNVNPIRYKLNEDLSVVDRNINNTLSFEEITDINDRNFVQKFEIGDVVRTQFKSNYGTNQATLIDCDGNETALTVVKATDNINISDVRDGKVINLPSGEFGIYFGSGNTYDPDTLLQNGSYNLLEYLPDWVNVGDWLNVEGLGWGRITNIIAPSYYLSYYHVVLTLENDLNYADDTVVKITSIYNVVDYDRYEFDLDTSLLEGNYQIRINCTDTNFPAVEFLSEWLDIQTEHEKHLAFNYYSTRNNEINYGTGVTFGIRLPYVLPLKWKPKEEQELYVTDTRTISLDNKVREYYDLNLMPLPTAMAQKVVLILAHNRLFINGISYLLDGETEVLSLGSTNLYQIKATLVRSDYVFENAIGVTAGEILLGSGVPLAIDANARGLLFIE